jgi:hypothetical protein
MIFKEIIYSLYYKVEMLDNCDIYSKNICLEKSIKLSLFNKIKIQLILKNIDIIHLNNLLCFKELNSSIIEEYFYYSEYYVTYVLLVLS